MMKTNSSRYLTGLLANFLFGLLVTFAATTIVAAEEKAIFNTQISIGNDGLAVQQPVISQTDILKTLTQAHRLLSVKNKQAQTIIAEDTSGKNMIMVAIIPGGLLYLAYQRSKVANAKIMLTNIKSELENLDIDAVSLYQPVYKPTGQTILVARYP